MSTLAILSIGVAFAAVLLMLNSFGNTRRTSVAMLHEYDTLLSEAKRQRAQEIAAEASEAARRARKGQLPPRRS